MGLGMRVCVSGEGYCEGLVQRARGLVRVVVLCEWWGGGVGLEFNAGEETE